MPGAGIENQWQATDLNGFEFYSLFLYPTLYPILILRYFFLEKAKTALILLFFD